MSVCTRCCVCPYVLGGACLRCVCARVRACVLHSHLAPMLLFLSDRPHPSTALATALARAANASGSDRLSPEISNRGASHRLRLSGRSNLGMRSLMTDPLQEQARRIAEWDPLAWMVANHKESGT